MFQTTTQLYTYRGFPGWITPSLAPSMLWDHHGLGLVSELSSCSMTIKGLYNTITMVSNIRVVEIYINRLYLYVWCLPQGQHIKNVENKKTNMVSVRNIICFHGGFSTSMSTFLRKGKFLQMCTNFCGVPSCKRFDVEFTQNESRSFSDQKPWKTYGFLDFQHLFVCKNPGAWCTSASSTSMKRTWGGKWRPRCCWKGWNLWYKVGPPR